MKGEEDGWNYLWARVLEMGDYAEAGGRRADSRTALTDGFSPFAPYNNKRLLKLRTDPRKTKIHLDPTVDIRFQIQTWLILIGTAWLFDLHSPRKKQRICQIK